ncbi:MAG: endonuclease [Flavobacterium sp.]|nr:endonuclease [Flavobacterium sp.]
MPEGPSIVILKEEATQFKGKEVTEIYGNTSIDLNPFVNQQVTDFKSWGKHFLICFKNKTIRIHLLLFGSYRINESKTNERIGFKFENGELNFYACSVKVLDGKISDHYDFTADVMNPKWSPAKARKKLAEIPSALICDALLEQDIFAGVGNIIKNEVLYRVKVHPEARVGDIPLKKRNEIIKQATVYSFEFLEWKKNFVLKKHWLAHAKKKCVRCDIPLNKKQTGKKKRRSFFCNNCQSIYQ